MQRIGTRIPLRFLYSGTVNNPFLYSGTVNNPSFLPSSSSSVSTNKILSSEFSLRTPFEQQIPQRRALPGDLVKWASLGFCRGLSFATGFTPLRVKPLDSIIDIERAKNRLPEDLISVWHDYHLGRGHIGASISGKLYRLLEQRATSCWYFVIPLWRVSGYTTMFVQAQMPHILFTGLEDYKARGTQAAPYFTVTYYTEFEECKDVVLTRGDIVFTSKLSDDEAKWLLETAQTFYLNDMRYKFVERFNKQTHDFEFKDVLQALDMPLG